MLSLKSFHAASKDDKSKLSTLLPRIYTLVDCSSIGENKNAKAYTLIQIIAKEQGETRERTASLSSVLFRELQNFLNKLKS